MFDILSFLSGAAQGAAGNYVTRFIDAFWKDDGKEQEHEKTKDSILPEEIIIPKRLFQTFHIKTGFEAVLDAIDEPIVHVIVEDNPTTFYHLLIN